MNADDFRITALPGLAEPPAFAQYAGHVGIDDDRLRLMFFWLIESASSPATDPLVMWLNGGPGDSSLNGLFLENGPFQLGAGGGTVGLRPFAWNRHANVLYVDQPLGTGFSSVNDAGRVQSRERVVEDLYAFLHEFYSTFPAYRTRPLFIAGESFAGHYIPDIARRILDGQDGQDGPGATPINLAGVAIGDGWIDPLIQYRSNIDFAAATGLIGPAEAVAAEQVYQDVRRQIEAGTADETTFSQALASILADTGTATIAVNMYDICRYDIGAGFNWPEEDRGAIQAYLSRSDVVQALHAQGSGGPFQAFSQTVFHDLQPYYFSSTRSVLADLLGRVRVLVYGGQWDLVSNHLGLERVLASLEWAGAKAFGAASRYVWVVGGAPAGYSQTYGNLTYLMVINASHMVPYSVPAQAFDMITRFLGNAGYNDYLSGATTPF